MYNGLVNPTKTLFFSVLVYGQMGGGGGALQAFITIFIPFGWMSPPTMFQLVISGPSSKGKFLPVIDVTGTAQKSPQLSQAFHR